MSFIKWLFILPLLLSFTSFEYPLTPDPKMSPGHICTVSNGDFSEYRYGERIPYCQRNVSTELKKYIYDQYNVPVGERKNYTIDHIIPLSIGGSNDLKNLWPEHKKVKATRENLEVCLYEYVKNGRTSQKVAINIILKVKFNLPISEQHRCLNQ